MVVNSKLQRKLRNFFLIKNQHNPFSFGRVEEVFPLPGAGQNNSLPLLLPQYIQIEDDRYLYIYIYIYLYKYRNIWTEQIQVDRFRTVSALRSSQPADLCYLTSEALPALLYLFCKNISAIVLSVHLGV